ncbi:MAG: hypothetical protein GX082_04575 [Clostridiaceae bacterium]|nr:hypothetical protein [Clostridiaceae bacterium]
MFKKIMVFMTVTCILFAFSSCGIAPSSEKEETTSVTTTTPGTTTKSSETTKSAGTTTTTSTTTTVTTEANPLGEFYEISWLVRFTQNYEEGRWDELELEELFNVDIKVWNIDANNDNEMMMMYAAGDVPDFYWCTGRVKENYEQGLNRSIPKKMIREFAPVFYNMVDQYEGGWSKLAINGNEEEQYGINRMDVYFLMPYTVPVFRLDWLENLGFSLDNLASIDSNNRYFITDRQFTFSEINEIYRALTEDDPDGNGEDDTYALVFTPSHWFNASLMSSFGFVDDSRYLYYDKVTGNYVQYFAFEGYKRYLNWVTDLLEKGYIRELPGQEDWFNEYLAASGTGKVGCLAGMLDGFNRVDYDFFSTYPPNTVHDSDPDALFVVTPPHQTEDGTGRYKGYGDSPFIDGYAYTFGAGVDDGKAERILRIINYINENPDVKFRFDNGIEGVHYKWSGKPFKSPLIVTPIDKVPRKYPHGANMRIFGTADIYFDLYQKFNYSATHIMMFDYWKEKDLYRYALVPDKWISSLDVPDEIYDAYSDKSNEVMSGINSLVSDFYNRAFRGQISNIDNEWQQYIDTLYNAGYDDLVEYFNDEKWPMFKNYIADFTATLR